MGILCKFKKLEDLVIHGVNSLERYNEQTKKEQHLSIVFFSNNSEMESLVLAKILTKASRKSDAIFYKNSTFIMLMPATNKKNAKLVFNEISSLFKNLENMSVLSFPKDAFNDNDFYDKIKKIVKDLDKS